MKKIMKQALAAIMFITLPGPDLQAAVTDTRLYVATNKEYYSPAEKVQFQVFLLNPSPSTNHTAFIELFDCRGVKLVNKMFPFSNNISWGDVDLPETPQGQFYVLYCYVLSKDSVQSSCTKKIFISGKTQKAQKKSTVSVFYEGDTFIAESPNNILLRCTDENAKPISTKGKITDDKNQVYALFETNQQGYAKTRINPENKVPYYILLKDKDGNEMRTPLRMAMPNGITLNVSITQDSIVYNLVSYTRPIDLLPVYRIEALHNGQLVYDADIEFQNGLSTAGAALNQKDFPAGFLVFRIIDKTKKLYSQRVIYNSDTKLRRNVITFIDTINKKETTVELPEYVNGRAYLNVGTGDIGFHPENTPVFLENTENNSITINDQLIAAPDVPGSFYTPDEKINQYLSLTGTLLNNEKKPLKNKNVTLVLLHKNLKKEFLASKTDNDGNLQINNLVFFDTVTVYFQLADKSLQKNDVTLDLEVNPSLNFPVKQLPDINSICSDEVTSAVNQVNIKPDEKTLQQVVVTAEKEKSASEKFADRYISDHFEKKSGSTNEYDFIKNPPVADNISLVEFIKGRFAGIKVLVSASTGTPELTGTFGGTVGVYLNDMELVEGAYGAIANLTIKDVAMVRYYSMGFKPRMIQGDILKDVKAVNAGDLMIYTRADFVADEKTKGLPKTTAFGYNLEMPGFSSKSLINGEGSLFWKAGWDVEPFQTIYIGLPANKAGTNVLLTIEGINELMAPYRFTQKLIFN